MARLRKIGVPFPMDPCFSQDKRHRYMLFCLEHGFERLTAQPIDQAQSLSLVGFGPSLEDTWKDIKHPIMTMSGAHEFLINRRVIPAFHCDMDPRVHKVQMLNPHSDVQYLMATVCNPLMWEKLRGYKVKIWHAISGDRTVEFLRKKDVDCLLVGGGSCMGLVAIHLGGLLGFNHFEIHGYDGSFRGDKRHAGFHGGFEHGKIETKIYGKRYTTSQMMENSNFELQHLLNHYPIFCVFHGEGRNQSFVRMGGLPNCVNADSENVESIRNGKVIFMNESLAA